MSRARDRLYLDACVLNRLTDRSTELRVRQEAEAATHILDLVSAGEAIWIASTALELELSRNPDPETRGIALDLLTFATETIADSIAIHGRAQQLTSVGFALFDALHVAAGEQADATALLTVDDRLIRRAHRIALPLPVLNPVHWLQTRPR